MFPNFAKNVNTQIQQIISLIKDGSLPAYLEKDIPVKIKETLLNVTNDKLSVNIKDYLDFRKEKVVEKLTNTKNQLQKIEKNVFSDEELELKQNRLERITEIINALKKEKAILNNVIHMHNINKQKQKQLSQTLKEILDEQKHVNELIDNDEKLN